MTFRLEEIVSVIPECKVFADVGCDHGLISHAVLKRGKCESVVFSDVSAKCLKKAEELLFEYVAEGKAKAIVSNGFDGYYEDGKAIKIDCALIAGMGGEEIISIIDSAIKKGYPLPERLLLQPMKNCDKLRAFALKCGYAVDRDFVFSDGGKYYDLILLKKGKDSLTDREIKYGRDNIKNPTSAFIERLLHRRRVLSLVISKANVSEEAIKAAHEEIEEIDEYVKFK